MEDLLRLLRLFRDLRPAAGLSPADWTPVVAAARAANLLGSLAERLNAEGIVVAGGARRHLEGARQLSARQRQSVAWEVRCLDEALAGLGVPVVLLKGAAYALGEHPNGRGRLFGDIDLLVPSDRLPEAEILLMTRGWSPGRLDPYDDRYYRQWMHELPPMLHIGRGTVLDVHHTILPPTAGRHPDPAAIAGRAQRLPGHSVIHVPCVEDLVIHSLVHLWHEGEFHHGLRDLHDIDSLLARNSAQAGFWERLTAFAVGHDVAQPVGLGLALASRVWRTPVPDAVTLALCGRNLADLRRHPTVRLFATAVLTAVCPSLPLAARLPEGLLYLRSHWLRMPSWRLAQHLLRKAAMRLKAREAGPSPE